jgi:hypothetical protein
MKLQRGDNFEVFAGNLFKKYREYKDMCENGLVSEESEYSLVQFLIDNTVEVFGTVTNPWALFNNKKDRPETVIALITLLLDADKQIGYSKKHIVESLEGNLMKKAKTQNDDIQDMLKTLITKANMRNHGIKTSSEEVCFKFANNGKCAWGDNCRFKHVADALNNRETDYRSNIKQNWNANENECKYMLRYGNCRKGNICNRFSSHTASLKKFNEEKLRKGNILEA